MKKAQLAYRESHKQFNGEVKGKGFELAKLLLRGQSNPTELKVKPGIDQTNAPQWLINSKVVIKEESEDSSDSSDIEAKSQSSTAPLKHHGTEKESALAVRCDTPAK